MPQGNNSPAPPEAMTWNKAIPVIVVAGVFDALGLLFEGLVFFGPALVGVYCATTVGGVWVIGKLLTAGCAAGAIAAGTAASVALIGFGEIMALAIGLVGWLAVGLILVMTNRRIFKKNTLWFVGSLLMTEMPVLGSLPFVSFIVWRMYSRQIQAEEAAMKKWKEEQAARQTQERNTQVRAAQMAQAANDAEYLQAANDAQYALATENQDRKQEQGNEIPEKMDQAA